MRRTVKTMYSEFHEKLYDKSVKHLEFSESTNKLHEEVENWLKEAEKTKKKVSEFSIKFCIALIFSVKSL